MSEDKKMAARLVELEAQRNEARGTVEQAREKLIAGAGKLEALTTAQGTYSAVSAACAELERRIMAAERESDEQERRAKSDEARARLKVLCDADSDDEAEIAAGIGRIYQFLDSELDSIAGLYATSGERQFEIARTRQEFGEDVSPFPAYTPERTHRLLGFFEQDEKATRLFSGSVKTAFENVLRSRA
jgi:hypothetical protein